MKKYITILILILLAVPFVSSASIDFNLKYGQKSTEVSELQDFLIHRGLLQSNSTGFFGLMTLKAVKAYQTSVSVPSTGYVGTLTRAKINSEITSALSSSIEAEIAETGTTTLTNKPQVVTKYATTTIIQYVYQNTPTPNQPVVNTPPQTSSEPIVSQICQAAMDNYKDRKGSVYADAYKLTADAVCAGKKIGHVTVTGFTKRNIPCFDLDSLNKAVADGITTFGGASNNFGTINFIGDGSAISLQDTQAISITVNSPQKLNSVKLTPFDKNTEYLFFVEQSGVKTATMTGTGSSALPFTTPLSVSAHWTDKEPIVTFDFTLNFIKFVDGTEAGGLPLTVKGLQITKCVSSN